MSRQQSKTKICFVITGLGVGGAEYALLRLLSRFDYEQFDISVVVLGREDALASQFTALGITLIKMGMAPGKWPFSEIGRFLQVIREIQPDILQGWMYHGNLAASFAASRLKPTVPVCWSVRDTPDAAHQHSFFTRMVIKLSSRYAWKVERIFNVSAHSADYCCDRLGWPRAQTEVLPNGIDTARFAVDREIRQTLRDYWRVKPDAFLVGIVARWTPVKNHKLFLMAAAKFQDICPEALFVMVGSGLDLRNKELMKLLDQLNLKSSVRLMGVCENVEKLYPVLDVLALTSKSEGFPNVLAEAMSCGIPVVSTDVGDARDIIGNVAKGKNRGVGGLVVPAKPKSFAEAWKALLDAELRERIGLAGRKRIENVYALDTVVQRLQQRYQEMLVRDSE